MKRSFLATSLLLACFAAAAHATVPSTLSYQGVLTDNLGAIQPDGLYNFVFKVYNVGSGGSALWTETDNNVQLTKGSFTVLLGNVTPLNLPFDVPYYLGISVNGQPELSPRVPLASSAYGLSLRLPFSGSETSSGAVFAITNTGSGPDILSDHWLQVGSGSADGQITVAGPGAPNGFAFLQDYSGIGASPGNQPAIVSGLGGALELFDTTGNGTIALVPDVDGAGGGFMFVNGNSSGYTFVLDGNYSGTGSPRLALLGANPISLNSSATGDASVVLPANAIDASEVLDEPGLAQNHLANTLISITSTNSSALTDLISVTITIPAAGYVELAGDFQANLTNSTTRYIGYQITETSGAGLDANTYFYAGAAAASLAGYVPCSIHRTYFKASPGSYTFYLQALNGSGSGALAWNPTLTAHYYPTGYGSVVTAVAASDAATYPDATPVVRADAPGQATGTGGYQVDLHELELQVTREQTRLRDAEARLAEARSRAQVQTGAQARAQLARPKRATGGR